MSMTSSRPTGELYVWGKDIGGSLGGVDLDREAECPLPTRVPGLSDVASVAAGEGTTAVVTGGGELLCFGAAHPRLGLGAAQNAIPQGTPRRVGGMLLGKRVVQVALGEGHALCVTDDALCHAWGKGNHGCLADGDTSLRHARHEPALVMVCRDGRPLGPVVQVSAGCDLSVALLAGGDVFTWGRNDFGQLGVGRLGGCAAEPQLVPLPPDAEAEAEPEVEAETGADSEAHLAREAEAAAAKCGKAANSVVALSVSCGSLYMGAVTTRGVALCWGYGLAGNLGCGSRLKAATRPMRVKLPPGEQCVRLACTVGQVSLSGGGGTDGMEGPHTLLVGASGVLYACGTHHKGLCGNLRHKAIKCTHRADALTPYRVGDCAADAPADGPTRYLEGVRCLYPVSAHIHNAVVDDRGRLWTFGCGSNGRLGLEVYTRGLHGKKARMKCYVMAPTQVQLDHGHGAAVIDVASGRRHMAAIVARCSPCEAG